MKVGCIQKDKHSIKLFASYDKDEDGFSFGDRTMIPLGEEDSEDLRQTISSAVTIYNFHL